MIRERVSMRGVCRPLEDASELPSLNMPLDEIGVIKEGPVSFRDVFLQRILVFCLCLGTCAPRSCAS